MMPSASFDANAICNVISLKCNNTDEVYNCALLTAYFQVWSKYE